MFRPLSLFIGLRYTRAKRRNHFISFISLVSMLGIAVGVTALITVISVMNGFETELRARILGMISHATISGAGQPLVDWQSAVTTAEADPRVIGAAPFIERESMLQGSRVSGAMLRGVLPELEPKVSEIADKMVEGELDVLTPGAFNVILGSELAQSLGVEVGDELTVYAPQLRPTPAGVVPTVKRFHVQGIFTVGMHEYDSAYALVHMDDARRLYRMGEGVSGVRLKLQDLFQAWDVARDLADQLPGFYRVDDWSRFHYNFFRAVKTEKLVMFIILSLIVAVAAFNLVSTLVMVVTDKQADIAILRTLGLAPGAVMRVFMVQGTIVGVIGTLIGAAGGVLLATNLESIIPALERLSGQEFMPADVYYISQVPSEMHWSDVGMVCTLSLVFSILATLYPAWRASRTQPADALRYE